MTKRKYIIPLTEKVNFGADEATMKFSGLTDASNPGGPSGSDPSSAPMRKVNTLYI